MHFFLDLVDFQIPDLQEALDAPSLHSLHMPSSFYPRHAQPGVIEVEERIPPAVREELAARGHRVRCSGPWSHGRVMAVTRDPESGCLEAAASPRFQIAYAAVLP